MLDGPDDQRRYRFLDVVGAGGFGTVYRAELLQAAGFVKPVAIKLLHPSIDPRHQALERLRDEARMLGLLNHRAIVQVHGLVYMADRWAVVMEYVDGVALDGLLEHGPLPLGVSLEIVEEVAEALHSAYAAPQTATKKPLRLLHRDIKPGNVQLTDQGEVKLLDFGVARAEFDAREAKTRGRAFGSRPYMAPERLVLDDRHTSDVFALAVTLCELVTGRLAEPTSGDPTAHTAWVDDRLADVDAPAALDALLRRCLAFEPDDRPTARQFATALRPLRADEDGVWLKDWAADVVEPLVAARTDARTEGEMSGRVVTEADVSEGFSLLPAPRGTAALDSLPPHDDATYDDIDVISEQVTIPEPPTPPPPPARARRRWTPGWGTLLGTCLTVGITGALLVMLASTGFGMATFGTLAMMIGAHQTLRSEAQNEWMEMTNRAQSLPQGRNREALVKLLTDGHARSETDLPRPRDFDRFKKFVDASLDDGRIKPAELSEIKRLYARLWFDRSSTR